MSNDQKSGDNSKINPNGTIHQTVWWDEPGNFPDKGHSSRDFDPITGQITGAHTTDFRGIFNWQGPNIGWHK